MTATTSAAEPRGHQAGLRGWTDAFDRWVRTGPFTPVDLGRFRILFAVVLLLQLTPLRWLAALPDSAFGAPPGPFRVLGAFPPEALLVALEIATAVAVAALALGWRTTAASVATGLLLVLGFGLTYSTGKIDHTIFLVITPLVLTGARWGEAVSVDAVRRGTPPREQPQWPLRFLALLMALGFLTAAWPKLRAGWLDLDTQAVRGTLFGNFYVDGRQDLLAPYALEVTNRWVWEAADWSAVALEAGLVLALLHWRTWRVALAVLTLFHAGVYLVLNIRFWINVLVYGAFVSWGRLPAPTMPRAVVDKLVRGAPLVALGVGLLAWAAPRLPVPPVVVLLGAVAGAAYLAWVALSLTLGARRLSRV